jgi:hypothetical protein
MSIHFELSHKDEGLTTTELAWASHGKLGIFISMVNKLSPKHFPRICHMKMSQYLFPENELKHLHVWVLSAS